MSFQSRPPVMSVSGRLIRPPGGVRACCLARSKARSYSVLDGGVEQSSVAQAHLGGGVSKQRHQCLQGDAGVDQGGGVGVAELVGCDVVQPGVVGGSVEFGADGLLTEPAAVLGEQELCGPPVSGVRHRASG